MRTNRPHDVMSSHAATTESGSRPTADGHPRTPHLDTTITFRLTGIEKELISFFAQAAGLSVGRFLVGLMKRHGEVQLESIRPHIKQALDLRPFLSEERVRRRPRFDPPRAMELPSTF